MYDSTKYGPLAHKISCYLNLEAFDSIEFRRMPATANAGRIFARRAGVLKRNISALELFEEKYQSRKDATLIAKGMRLQHLQLLASVLALIDTYNENFSQDNPISVGGLN